MAETFIQNLIFFFAAIDPIGTVPVFLAVTLSLQLRDRIMVAIKSCAIAALILLAFIVAGEFVLTASKIPLSAFQVAGGIVLFLFALTMLFGDAKPESELKSLKNSEQTAVFPLAIPSIASPGALLAAVMLTEKDRFQLYEQILTALSMLTILLATLVILLLACFFSRWISIAASAVMSRIMGIIVASLAVTHVLTGLQTFFAVTAALE